MDDMDRAAERLALHIHSASLDDPILRHLDAAEFMRSKGFDISTIAGCKGALMWLRDARVEDAFWDDGKVDNAADWYLGEARLDALIKIVENRLSNELSVK